MPSSGRAIGIILPGLLEKRNQVSQIEGGGSNPSSGRLDSLWCPSGIYSKGVMTDARSRAKDPYTILGVERDPLHSWLGRCGARGRVQPLRRLCPASRNGLVVGGMAGRLDSRAKSEERLGLVLHRGSTGHYRVCSHLNSSSSPVITRVGSRRTR